MLSLFKRKKGTITAAHRGWNQLGGWMLGKQRICADWLQTKSSELTPWQLKMMLLAFFLIMASWSSYILIQAFNHSS